MKQLHERMDDIFANGNHWQHRTLRTIFDPFSAEWNMTTMDEKLSIIKQLINKGENLELISAEYKRFYEKNLNRPDIAKDLEKGLIYLLENFIQK